MDYARSKGYITAHASTKLKFTYDIMLIVQKFDLDLLKWALNVLDSNVVLFDKFLNNSLGGTSKFGYRSLVQIAFER